MAEYKRHSITLAVKRIPSPHTGKKIQVVETIIGKFEIFEAQLNKVLMDSGSNMVKAFKNNMTENGGVEDEGDECELADNKVTQLTEGSWEVTELNQFGNENETTGPNLEDEPYM